MTEMLKEAKRLYGLGFGIILLHPREKRPINSSWQKGPRSTWKEIEAQYRAGMNIGVSLGERSKLKDTTKLAVIDCDVKSALSKHLKEMQSKLKELGVKDETPRVLSGRGNGSLHLYVKTKKTTSPKRFSQSSEKVKVLMPSAKKFTPYELQHLTRDEVKKGIHLRAAWEISIMGEGQQVVLPPSIHPDSGKPYKWGVELTSIFDIPEMNFDSVKTDSKPIERKAYDDFKFIDVDLWGRGLDTATVDLIYNGLGCSDRSAGLLKAAIALKRADFSREEILSLLTDRDTYLGECGYEHAQSNSRVRAAKWVERYTLAKADAATDLTSRFADAEDSLSRPLLSKVKAAKQEAGILKARHWRQDLDRHKAKEGQDQGAIKVTFQNVLTVLRGAVNPKLFKFNEFANTDHYGVKAPWRSIVEAEVTDKDTTRMKDWFGREQNMEVPNDKIFEAVTLIGDENAFHPVREYLRGLHWDGKPRIDTWLKDYLGARGPEPYLSEVSRKVLCAMVARVMDPGCKFDHVLILEGKTGRGKSTAASILAGEWFTDSPLEIENKDAILNMSGRWVVELGELPQFKADVNKLKGFITTRIDRMRTPYGKRAQDFPRQCIFIGTTNDDEYLRDPTGNRRYWPVKVSQTDFVRLKRDRDQLLAEAFVSYILGEDLWLKGEAEIQAVREQKKRTFQDVLVDELEGFLTSKETGKIKGFNPMRFSLQQLFEHGGQTVDNDTSERNQKRIGSALRVLGFEKSRGRDAEGIRHNYFIKGKKV